MTTNLVPSVVNSGRIVIVGQPKVRAHVNYLSKFYGDGIYRRTVEGAPAARVRLGTVANAGVYPVIEAGLVGRAGPPIIPTAYASSRNLAIIENRVAGKAVNVFQASSPSSCIVGIVKAAAYNNADVWSLSGFPAPKVEGYSYSRDAGIVRTKFRSGNTRQRVKWDDGRRNATVSFNIELSKLSAMEAFVNNRGYDWFTMGIITEDNLTDYLRAHLVRITSEEGPRYGNIYGDTIEVAFEIELQ